MGTREDQYARLKADAGLVDLSTRELLRVTGEDRVSFIHGMVTQDVTGLPDNAWAYAALGFESPRSFLAFLGAAVLGFVVFSLAVRRAEQLVVPPVRPALRGLAHARALQRVRLGQAKAVLATPAKYSAQAASQGYGRRANRWYNSRC